MTPIVPPVSTLWLWLHWTQFRLLRNPTAALVTNGGRRRLPHRRRCQSSTGHSVPSPPHRAKHPAIRGDQVLPSLTLGTRDVHGIQWCEAHRSELLGSLLHLPGNLALSANDDSEDSTEARLVGSGLLAFSASDTAEDAIWTTPSLNASIRESIARDSITTMSLSGSSYGRFVTHMSRFSFKRPSSPQIPNQQHVAPDHSSK